MKATLLLLVLAVFSPRWLTCISTAFLWCLVYTGITIAICFAIVLVASQKGVDSYAKASRIRMHTYRKLWNPARAYTAGTMTLSTVTSALAGIVGKFQYPEHCGTESNEALAKRWAASNWLEAYGSICSDAVVLRVRPLPSILLCKVTAKQYSLQPGAPLSQVLQDLKTILTPANADTRDVRFMIGYTAQEFTALPGDAGPFFDWFDVPQLSQATR